MPKLTRQKILEILLTACLSALISALQNILSAYVGNSPHISDPGIAAVVGAFIHTARV